MGGALFSMHFGASCMLYPVTWGKEAGASLPAVYIGIFISGIVLPFLGYIALVKGGGNFMDITYRISRKFGVVFVAATIIVLGPLYVVPRMSAAAWDAIRQFFGVPTNKTILPILFSIMYYAVIYWFVSSRSKVVNRVGKILFPILIVIVIAVILKSILNPISDTWTPPSFDINPVIYGVLQGYTTGDLQCSLMFGLVVVQGIRNTGINESAINKNLIKVGVVGLGMLAVAHLGHMLAGANLGGTIDLELAALYTQMVVTLWGRVGGVFFNMALVAASMTAAIGCVSSTAEIWVKVLHEKYSYRLVCAASCAISCVICTAGLDKIVTVVGPILDACYPAAIVLAVFYCFAKNCYAIRKLFAAKCALVTAFLMGMIHLLYVYNSLFGWEVNWFERVYLSLPFAKYSLAWIPVSVFAYIIGYAGSPHKTGEIHTGSVAIS